MNSYAHPCSGGSSWAGFTLLELMVATALAAILAAIAYPSFQAPLQKSRRSDALVALMQLQGAQERWRSEHPNYASLAELDLPALTTGGHFAITVRERDASRFTAMASASGAQAHDRSCRFLRLSVHGADTLLASGPDESATNPPATNRQCWSH